MKQIIKKYDNNGISNKYYLNHLNRRNGLDIGYLYNGSILWKSNYLNGKRFSLDYWYDTNAKIEKITYHL